jgi:hypothetical protein
MNYEQAVRLLDRIKDGQTFPLPAINLALEITGDIDESTTTHKSQYEQPSFKEMYQVQRDARA